jgi:hypothetical protein
MNQLFTRSYLPMILLIALLANEVSSQSASKSWTLNPYDEKLFIENAGQFRKTEALINAPVLYSFEQGSTAFFLCPDRFVIRRMDDATVSAGEGPQDPATRKFSEPSYSYFTFHISSANTDAVVEGEGRTSAVHKYYLPDEEGKKQMITAACYQTVIYKDVYDGIDLVFAPHDELGMKYQFVVHAGADPSQISFRYSGPGTLHLDQEGNMLAGEPGSEMIDRAPFTYYAQSGAAIPSSFNVDGNAFSFLLGSYDKHMNITIDPWVIDPEFTDENKAFDIASDFLGNVYAFGGHAPWQYKKFDPNGNALWTFETPYDEWYGAFAVDPGGNSVLVEGCCGGNIIRLDPDGNVVWNIANGVDEYWRVVYTCDYSNLYLAAGYASSAGLAFTSISLLDAETGDISNSTNVFEGQTSEPRALAVGLDGSIYAISCTGSLDANEVASLTPSFSIQYSVSSGYGLLYNGPLYANGINSTAGQNAVSGGNNFFCTTDGATLYKRAVSDGNELSSVTISNGSVEGNSGVLVDSCDYIFAGSANAVIKYDADLNVISSTSTTGAVYCLAAGINGALLVAGNGFISSLDMSVCRKFCGGKYAATAMVSAENQIRIFPNPADEMVTVDASRALGGGSQVLIVVSDLLGQKLMETSASVNGPFALNAEQLPAGIYLLEVRTEGRMFSTRLVKE